MGLPLFVAPIESDLPPKAADKSRATSPARSSIRHHSRPDSRGRRSLARRHAALNDRMNALRQTLDRDLPLPSSVDRDLPPLPWSARASTQDNDTQNNPSSSQGRPFREVLRELARSEEQRRDRAAGLDSIFGISWQDEEDTNRADNNRSEMDLGWWGHESRLARNGNTTTQLGRSESASRPSQRVTLESLIADRRRRRAQHRSLLRETTAARSDLEEQQRLLRIHALNRPREVNGLGDRDRSLSPEVWDTLLTTLTPDPQPPSAGSSFASIAASQNAGVSSATPLTTHDMVTEPYSIDPGCDSGCDNSDTEVAPYENAYLRSQRRGGDPTRRSRRGPPRVVYMPVDGPVRTSNGRETNSDPTLPTSRQRPSEDLMVAAAVDGEGSVSFSRWRRPTHGWVGQFSVGNSDDEQGVERRSLNREGSMVSANLTSQGDDDWSGMQRIVRSLARREDIPDEWWTEAGLIRTLPQDGAE